MSKFRVYVPIHSGFEVIVEADNEDDAKDMALSGDFENEETDNQILDGQQLDDSNDVIVEEIENA